MESGTRQGYGTAIEQQADFTAEDLLRVAKRHNNRKRKYILVNPLQGKHVPVSPSLALSMMQALGDKVAARHGDARLVIGFAETATAIGAVVANAISEECVYLQTTREELPDLGAHIDFLEEHSHAPEQSLVTEHLEEWLARTDTVVFVDDEISTGKTICNIIARLKEEFPALEGKRLVAASILNRLSPENEQRLEAAGVKSEWLVRLPQTDYTMLVEKFQAEEAAVAPRGKDCAYERHLVKMGHDPRRGTAAGEYFRQWEQSADEILAQLTLLGQLGLSLAMPILMCLGACYLLCTRLNAPLWIYLPGMILGIGASFMTAYKVYLAVTRKEKRDPRDPDERSYNRHM